MSRCAGCLTKWANTDCGSCEECGECLDCCGCKEGDQAKQELNWESIREAINKANIKHCIKPSSSWSLDVKANLGLAEKITCQTSEEFYNKLVKD